MSFILFILFSLRHHLSFIFRAARAPFNVIAKCDGSPDRSSTAVLTAKRDGRRRTKITREPSSPCVSRVAQEFFLRRICAPAPMDGELSALFAVSAPSLLLLAQQACVNWIRRDKGARLGAGGHDCSRPDLPRQNGSTIESYSRPCGERIMSRVRRRGVRSNFSWRPNGRQVTVSCGARQRQIPSNARDLDRN